MTGDAVIVAPDFYKVVLENNRVRVLEVRARPGDKTEMQAHPDQVAIAIADSRFRFTPPDGQAMEVELKAGQAVYVGAVVHTAEALGDSGAHVLLIELK